MPEKKKTKPESEKELSEKQMEDVAGGRIVRVGDPSLRKPKGMEADDD